MDQENRNAFKIHLVSSTDSPEFARLTRALTRSSLVALDAEWKPTRTQQSSFPTVSLLQLACRRLGPRLAGDSDDSPDESEDSVVFLVDLLSVPLPSIWELLRDLFVSPDILKLGFRFKQDLVYLSSTFSSHGCNLGFDRVEPFLDITSIYNYLQHKQLGRKMSKDIKSLAAICTEVLGICLSKELQCSDWSLRPLTEAQRKYAAMDAHCLLDIFNVFQAKVIKEGSVMQNLAEQCSPISIIGLKEILEEDDRRNNIIRTRFCEALDIVRATACSDISQKIASEEGIVLRSQHRSSLPMDESLLKVVKKYGDKLLLKESDKKPKISKKKGKRRSSTGLILKEKPLENSDDWQGPPPWDLSLGGNGCPKFLCDVMVEGLAKHLRCVGMDAAIPSSKKPEARELIDQAQRENRILLTRDAKLLRHEYIIKNQIYRVKSLLKNEQLLEIIETFQLKISEDQLMSRCTKCNGRFIQKPLTTEEAVEAAKGFQRIPDCLFDKNLEFWQCMDCNQLYWEGTQYKNAVQKFIDVCKLND
ncbi:DNA polymerase [Trema orientale]|uniref:DNA polymerase n=1 Tax=Trema orientale TaxID=63057 RepID=A0A2P5E6W9_TREOI|nr:DNA polymerase [Trema orientale]